MDVSIPYAYAEVCKVAEELLRHDRFDLEDMEFLGIKLPLEPRKNTPISNHRDPRDDPIQPLLSPLEAKANLKALDQERATAKGKDDVETLIHKLSRMSLSDPDYALYYYHAMKLDADVGKVFPRPIPYTPAPTSAPAPMASLARPP